MATMAVVMAGLVADLWLGVAVTVMVVAVTVTVMAVAMDSRLRLGVAVCGPVDRSLRLGVAVDWGRFVSNRGSRVGAAVAACGVC